MFFTSKAELMKDIHPDGDTFLIKFYNRDSFPIKFYNRYMVLDAGGDLFIRWTAQCINPITVTREELSFKYVCPFAGWDTAVATYIRNDHKTSGLLESSRD